MVSKVAVIALVAIVAVPIMMGYAFNLNETTKTEYTTGIETNVTEYITGGTYYSYMDMNAYEINFKNFCLDFPSPVYDHYWDPISLFPLYQTTSARTSIPLDVEVTDTPQDADLTDYRFYQLTSDVDLDRPNDYQLRVRFYQADVHTWSGWMNRVSVVSWNYELNKVSVIYHPVYDSELRTANYSIGNVSLVDYELDNYTGESTIYTTLADGSSTTYADLTKGYKLFNVDSMNYPNDTGDCNWWVPPSVVKSALFTIDLSTVSNSLTFTTLTENHVNTTITLTRTTSGGDVLWYVNNTPADSLVYDNTASENVYQILFSNEGVKLYYVGSWPSTMGLANYYREWSFDWSSQLDYYDHFQGIRIDKNGGYPKMRVDQAKALASVFDAIVDYTYDPAQLIGSSNISTTIKSVSFYGTSLTFGGETYAVKNRSLELGTHNVSLFGMTFESVLNGSGQYDNKINGNTISTTADPSTLTFNGPWAANVVSAPLVTTTVTETEWTPGVFAWDGIDDNFLMVGLLTSLGVFIALGVYSRRSKASVWPLMLVAGGATFLFLIMM